jgi:hypothetical protein
MASVVGDLQAGAVSRAAGGLWEVCPMWFGAPVGRGSTLRASAKASGPAIGQQSGIDRRAKTKGSLERARLHAR